GGMFGFGAGSMALSNSFIATPSIHRLCQAPHSPGQGEGKLYHILHNGKVPFLDFPLTSVSGQIG
ncbi:hypothetical protein, partial [Thermanaerothrix sp.]|uniref:hypothetical protein n=1 Tax=Thermanaerothrix sp. TaxID=2972675 RepID=UPI002ADE75BB